MCDAGSTKAPSFIILGSQKSGTTSLYEYINQHPLVVKSKRRETHFFDWRWNKELIDSQEQYLYYLKFFEQEYLYKHSSLMSGESTPSYLLHR